jgi:hypothetical protein
MVMLLERSVLQHPSSNDAEPLVPDRHTSERVTLKMTDGFLIRCGEHWLALIHQSRIRIRAVDRASSVMNWGLAFQEATREAVKIAFSNWVMTDDRVPDQTVMKRIV